MENCVLGQVFKIEIFIYIKILRGSDVQSVREAQARHTTLP
jgi:hypothetical protein